jgi:peptidoglycan-N-acetylglucosamine deacetylase
MRERFIARTSSALPRVMPGALCSLTDTGSVAITFDDGPHPDATSRALDALDEAGLRATFFLSGERVREQRALARAIHERGHGLGNHAYRHERMFLLSRSRVEASVRGTSEAIAEATGVASRFFRPPYGHWNPSMTPLLEALGLRLVLWNCMPCDFLPGMHGDAMRRALQRSVRGGSIIVLHDNAKTSDRIVSNIRALAAVLQQKNLSSVLLPGEARA